MAFFRYPRVWPDLSNVLEDFEKARRQMDRLVSSFAGTGFPAAVSGVFPPLMVREDGDTVYIEAEVPGISPDDIDISVHGRTLTLSGERRPDQADGANYHRRERKWGSFRKAVTLPDDVNSEAVQAQCRDGMLRIVLPKAEQAKPRKIAIKGE